MTDHWVGMFPRYGGAWNTQQAFNAAPDLKGVLRRIIWKELYTLDQIDLGDLVEYAAFVRSKGKKLSLMIEDKTFYGDNPMPGHLKSLAVRNRTSGWSALRWHPKVQAEYIKVMCEVQKLPDIHSISLMETAAGIPSDVLQHHGYSPELYGEMYTNYIRALYRTGGKPVFWHTNYIPQDQPGATIDRVLESVLSLKTVRLGGPDWWPTDKGLMARAYPRYAKWKDRGMMTFTMMSTPSYMQNVDGEFLTPKELMDGAVDHLKCNNIFWCFTRLPPVDGAYCYFDAAHLMHP